MFARMFFLIENGVYAVNKYCILSQLPWSLQTYNPHGRGESSALNFSEKRRGAESRWGEGPCAGGGPVLSRQLPWPAQAAEPFYNDFFCMLRLLQVWTRRSGQGWTVHQ